MSLHRKFIVSLAAASALLAGSAQAQYVGPTAGPTAPSSVAAILKNPVDDQAVVLRGHLLRKVGRRSTPSPMARRKSAWTSTTRSS